MKEQRKWTVIATEQFKSWLSKQDEECRIAVLTSLNNLRFYGPQLSRPYADTVKGSKYVNMKELRVQHQGKPIRAFFAFDPLRQAIVLCAGDKSGDKQFYNRMIRLADNEFSAYLATLEKKDD
ncbi:type II toxin-antitoxin system RelE/ParE family toxin [Avibacterium sp. 21-594]|uniref:type II toxin-antitoxin system RelE/ParE family toxin n=1 Tax=Avibacterium sp. 21-594 TaxID=2911535 RepID=UPI00224726AD|nr:type II toxin-antitoxin system RelE/ParE family toxin [Avibacterium sp. 21-594]MCW9716635.1 type II toxin-antitoxin system RelE/ParE family toxin [Avibacterium sp. 21-594]